MKRNQRQSKNLSVTLHGTLRPSQNKWKGLLKLLRTFSRQKKSNPQTSSNKVNMEKVDNIAQARSLSQMKTYDFNKIMRLVLNELRTQKDTIQVIKGKMDKQINKVKKDVQKKDLKKAKKDIGTLLKMDKKFDAKLEKCDKVMKKKKK